MCILTQVIVVVCVVQIVINCIANLSVSILCNKLKKENKANIDKVSDEILRRVGEELNKSLDKSL
ncbi:Uncharacterised protein [Clostridioides difficile]|uniref:hypothetical protein n=1 Tax=Clostridioides difficile TaxID=1496 RepID=UPI000D1D604A|nr:hypothetical protein [Clostridioides difficile]UWD43107.1 hypothetical protein NYF05_09045 [Clostridioides difficile]UWD46695.1 hypothetical protein NYU56_08790 [Clostridioides difficile]VFF94188.1 Uncharacterised protein [Clostridioides difficile]VIG02044.1 Uncharacterised protein [Clostridioides difficile]HBE9436080.1 hypothetical protein [Clostridioides difficile]